MQRRDFLTRLGAGAASLAGAAVAGSNGWIAVAAGNSNAANPSPSAMLQNQHTAWYAWKDLDPPAGGAIIEQQQILTTQNLAAVFSALELTDRFGAELNDLAQS